ncbi:phosphoribosylformylglycinamidine cyclo-ligase [Corynebacterium sp. MSK218]|uniref:phosphoribosylformylglycinamidine cyclo-ligase n=1 Tax=unclassified Corynebacterium TaxID=2624378 RepID=UPI0008A5B452|nr:MULTISPECIES: phosphoribosylformylglycinamidine cyclo-ligase [unclassified Corynebacterium]MDK8763568.1 phosphoribosylformylglycinamidine cyclo-ligase [Corynebacterium sp. MSK218]OFR66291.1 phosphoribosylformylglycinamidine cyclo-ligase [Corynebacterium sp. HMSC078H07]
MSDNTYAAAGVNIEEGDRAVELITPHAKRASRPEVMGGLGGFAGLFKLGEYKEPVLAAGSDGVGTKLAVAQAMDKHDTIGIDLVAMCVDDLVVCGAEPLFLQDYIAVGEVVPEKVAEIVKGIAEGCVQAGAALLGGETAEHPGVMGKEEYDVSATAVGVVEADELLGPDKVSDGDVLIAMKSSGLHSNGYSLARYVLLEQAGLPLDGYMEDLGRTLGEELLEPTRIYAKDCLALTSECAVSTFCHVTGGGLAGNLERVIPEGLTAEVSRSTWTPGQIFKTISSVGKVSREEMEKTFNMGVGMIAVVAPEDRERALAMMTARHVEAWELGAVRAAQDGEPRVVMTGEHPGF